MARHPYSTVLAIFLAIATLGTANAEDGATEKQIRELIEKLASKNSPPRGEDIELEYPTDWSEKHQQLVEDAQAQLSGLGKSAFPLLLENLGDDRYARTVSYSVEVNLSVGEVCRQIIESNVDVAGMRYKPRRGADGKFHNCPDFFADKFRGDLQRWWRENNAKTLREMQLDALRWRITEEDRIGIWPKERAWQSKGLAELTQKLKELESSK